MLFLRFFCLTIVSVVLTGKLLQKLLVFKVPIEIIHIFCLIPDFFVVMGISEYGAGGVKGRDVNSINSWERMLWVINERGGLDITLLAKCEGEEVSPCKVRRQLAEEPMALCREQGRGRAGKGELKVLSKEVKWEQGQEQYETVVFDELDSSYCGRQKWTSMKHLVVWAMGQMNAALLGVLRMLLNSWMYNKGWA